MGEAVCINYAARLKEARKAKGLTQEKLGELLGLKKSAVSKYETGTVVNMPVLTKIKINDILGIDVFDDVPFKEEQCTVSLDSVSCGYWKRIAFVALGNMETHDKIEIIELMLSQVANEELIQNVLNKHKEAK